MPEFRELEMGSKLSLSSKKLSLSSKVWTVRTSLKDNLKQRAVSATAQKLQKPGRPAENGLLKTP